MYNVSCTLFNFDLKASYSITKKDIVFCSRTIKKHNKGSKSHILVFRVEDGIYDLHVAVKLASYPSGYDLV